MEKRKLIIGKVHDVGYRAFLLATEELFIPNFSAKNVKK
jgi:hypothetical protein